MIRSTQYSIGSIILTMLFWHVVHKGSTMALLINQAFMRETLIINVFVLNTNAIVSR